MNKTLINNRQTNLRRSPVAHACLTFSMLLAAGAANAAAGFGDTNGPAGEPVRAQTYYAHSPTGTRAYIPPEAASVMGATYSGDTGAALRKFIDPLPLVGATGTTLSDGSTSKYIPLAKVSAWVNPQGAVTGDDYYAIAVVEYTEKLHSDLANPTRLRGYVQIDEEASNGRTPLPDSKLVALKYPDGTAITIAATDINGKLTGAQVPALAYDNPHYLGPAIVANRGTPTRIKFLNLLPVGRYDATAGRRGDIFIPADETIAGAGVGPDGVTRYTQNRALIHLHGGDNPWISDGTPHQWITPAGEKAVLGAEMAKAGSPMPVETFLRGAGAINVPDMNDPGDGAMTYYFPNGQSARMEWYHDHSYGLTRLNVYAGMAAPYVLADGAQETALQAIPGFPKDVIRMVIQDKTFVPADIKLQDARWNADKVIPTPTVDDPSHTDNIAMLGKPLWGENEGDLWYPHVYEVNQDPSNGLDGTNPVGRWDWGPYFWPVFPALYNLPTGAVDDVTLTPEAWMDTPVINGVAYPTTTLEARAQRFQILNAANDRFWSLSFFVADSAVSEIQVTNGGAGYLPSDTVTITSPVGSGATATPIVDANGTITAIQLTNAGTGYSSVVTSLPTVTINTATGSGAALTVKVADNTEVKMVPAAPTTATGIPACEVDADGVDIAPPYAPSCWPSTWPTDGREGGVPDPATAGPKMYQIGNEGGLLPQVAEIAAAPMQFEYNRRSITVLNTFTHGLLMGNAERADIVVDLTGYEGKTLIMYSDAPAPVPAFDPRNDHYTGKPDETGVGSVETPKAGFGPNTRTLMQIKVGDTLTAAQARLTAAQSAQTAANTAKTNADTALTNANGTLTTATQQLTAADLALTTSKNTFQLALDTYLAVVSTPTSPAYQLALVTLTAASANLYLAGDTQVKAQATYDAAAVTQGQAVVTAANAALAVTAANTTVAAAQAAVTAPTGGVTASFVALDDAALKATLPTIYAASQEKPIVAQSAYNAAFGENWSDAPQADGTKAFATIFTGTLQEPTFRFTPGTPNAGFTKVVLGTDPASKILRGSGYITPPVPNIAPPAAGGIQATATATLRVDHVNVTNAGSGFKFVPTVRFGNTGTGTGASAVARMQVNGVVVGAAGSGYTTAPAVTFSAPETRVPGWIQATGQATIDGAGHVTGIVIDNPGFGYVTAPLVAIDPPAVGGTRATVSGTDLSIAQIDLVSNDPNHPEFAGGAGYSDMNLVTVNITAPTGAGAQAAAATVTGSVFDITLVNPGSGYTGLPIIAIPAPMDAAGNLIPDGVAAQAVSVDVGGSILVKNKAIQELFDPTYGRMNATLGIEVPFTSALTQTTIPLGYVDPTTEEFSDGETQIWKITHNGVDAHPVHFHLFNVQVVNRIGWDGTIKPPMGNEYGWKETVRMNPLEDIVVAVRAKKPALNGFGLPLSVRLRDPSQPADVPMGFTQVDVRTGNPAVVTNVMDNFGWEYVWHCHILGHEENDFMRPMKFNANEAIPAAPSGLTYAGGTLNWTDNAQTEYKYQVYSINPSTASVTLVQDSIVANASSAAIAAPAAGDILAVVAVGANGNSGALTGAAQMATPTGAAVTPQSSTSLRFSWNAVASAPSYQAQISADGGITWTDLAGVTGTSVDATGLTSGNTYRFRVLANGASWNVGGVQLTGSNSAFTTEVSGTVAAAPGAPGITGAISMARIGRTNTDQGTMTITAPTTGGAVGSYVVQYVAKNLLNNNVPTTGWQTVSAANTTVSGNNVTFVVPRGFANFTRYWVRMYAINGTGQGANSNNVLSATTK